MYTKQILLDEMYIPYIYIIDFELKEKYKKRRFKSFVQSETDILKCPFFNIQGF